MKQARTAREERENLRKNGEPLEKTLRMRRSKPLERELSKESETEERAHRKGLENLRKRRRASEKKEPTVRNALD